MSAKAVERLETRPSDAAIQWVDLGERAYPIVIGRGLLAQAGALFEAHAPAKRVAVVTDANVAPLHLSSLETGLKRAGIRTVPIIVPSGESTKDFHHLQTLLEALLENGIERGDVVAALGGGVVGDLAGCAAGLLRRGVRFVQVPTSLLAQVDSSVGGKTGINTRQGKNLVGVFHQPALVLADIDTLETLSDREFRAGYAEVVKYGLINDAAFFKWLEERGGALRENADDLIHAITVSCASKADIVAADERESGARALLNLGHTFGHALEAHYGFDGTLIHGEAVSIGMAQAFRYSRLQGFCNQDDVERVTHHLASVGLPTRISHINGERPAADGLLRHIRQDKKVRDGALTFILTRGIGEAFIAHDVDAETVERFLEKECDTGTAHGQTD